MSDDGRSRPTTSRAQFAALVERLRVERRSVEASPATVLAALATVRDGVVVPLGGPPPGPQLPDGVAGPGGYRHRQWLDAGDGWAAVNDRLELDLHGAASMTHVDAREHFAWDPGTGTGSGGGSGTGGADGPGLPDRPAVPRDALAPWTSGWLGRGVLVDASDVPAGHLVTPDELAAILRRQSVEVRPGDALVLSFGRHRRPRRSDVPLGAEPEAGLSIACAPWLAQAAPALVVTDWGLDGQPSEVEGMPAPWHVLCLTALGVGLVDMADLSALVAACADRRRWEFALVMAALPLPHASGSPVNPLALL